MLYYEFNMEDALAVRYAEGEAKGVTIGKAEGAEKERSYIKSLLEQGLSHEELLKKLEENT